MRIEVDDLSHPEVQELLAEHLRSMHELSPPESVHALNLEALKTPDVTFWTAWDESGLAGCGALKELSATHGEVKSMRTPSVRRRRGAGRLILAHIVAEARRRGYERLSLETGSMAAFKPAHRLYESSGFTVCGPFGAYTEDPNSTFMSLELSGPQGDASPTPVSRATEDQALLTGSCHCGSVEIQLPSAPEMATLCNCSICRRLAALWAYYEYGTVRIAGHPENTQDYVQGDRTLRTVRCATCGCTTHWEPMNPAPGARHGVNLRNFDPELLEAVRVRRFDGADTWTFLD